MKDKEALLRMAEDADKMDYHATAVELFELYLKMDPERQSARFHLAENLRAIGLMSEAEKILKTIKEIPAAKRWLFELSWGEIYMSRAEFQIAEHCFKRATELNPTSTVPWVYLGACLARQERFDEECAALSKGLAASGDLDEVYLNLGYNQRALRKYENAQECFHKALEITPDYNEAKVALKDIENCLNVGKRH